MQALTSLPRLADPHDYAARHESCLDAEVRGPDVPAIAIPQADRWNDTAEHPRGPR
jgi:hypothetical protein